MKPPLEEEEFHHRHSAHAGVHRGATRRDHIVRSTAIIGVALFLVLGTPYLKRHLSTDGLGGLINSIGKGDVEGDREAVRRWLRDNEDDPHFEEIRWWAPREQAKRRHERREADHDAAEGRSASQVGHFAEDAPERVCRLKYRTKNQAGEEITRDDLFVLRDGKARLLARDSSLAIAARNSFSDDDGVP